MGSRGGREGDVALHGNRSHGGDYASTATSAQSESFNRSLADIGVLTEPSRCEARIFSHR